MKANAETRIEAGREPGEPSQHLTFLLNGEMFGLGILSIKEIIEYRELTPVPMMPAEVRGVINLRGAVVPVIDLLARFGNAPRDVGKRTCIVIVEAGADAAHRVIGIIVDAVSEVLDIAAADVEPPPMFGARFCSDLLSGVGKVRGKFVLLLNGAKLFDVDRVETAASAALA